jgi:hypothetical protein
MIRPDYRVISSLCLLVSTWFHFQLSISLDDLGTDVLHGQLRRSTKFDIERPIQEWKRGMFDGQTRLLNRSVIPHRLFGRGRRKSQDPADLVVVLKEYD